MDSSRPGSDVDDDIFEQLSEPVENVQDYHPGGLNPIYLGDSVYEGRYKILRKLGYGGYSTVWLAQDSRIPGSFVALKVVRADSDSTAEIKCYDFLKANTNLHPGCSRIMKLKDHFNIQGPNGKHSCLVYEVLGPSIPHVLVESISMRTDAYLTLSCARKVIYQVLLALDCMHSVGLVHGDVYAANVLFALRDLSQELADDLCQPHTLVSAEVKRLSGPQQPGDPRHLTLDCPLHRYISPDGNVKLSDLGNSFLESEPPNNPLMPPNIRSPEMIFDRHISMAQDIWAFGCLVYYVLTNRYPVDLSFTYTENARDDGHAIQLYSLLGPLPAEFKQGWSRCEEYFDNEGQLKRFYADDDFFSGMTFEKSPEDDSQSTPSDNHPSANGDLGKGADSVPAIASEDHCPISPSRFDPTLYPSIMKLCERKEQKKEADPKSLEEFVALNPPLRGRWMNDKQPDMQPEESELVLDLLQGLLVYDPSQRLPTKDLLQHPWIRDYCAPGNEPGDLSQETAAVQDKKRKRSLTDDDQHLDGGRDLCQKRSETT